MLLLLIVVTAVFGAAGDMLVNQWIKTNDLRWLAGSFPFWMATATAFGFVLRQQHFSFGIALIVILLVHSGLVLGWDVLIEGASISPKRWAGVTLALVALTLME